MPVGNGMGDIRDKEKEIKAGTCYKQVSSPEADLVKNQEEDQTEDGGRKHADHGCRNSVDRDIGAYG